MRGAYGCWQTTRKLLPFTAAFQEKTLALRSTTRGRPVQSAVKPGRATYRASTSTYQLTRVKPRVGRQSATRLMVSDGGIAAHTRVRPQPRGCAINFSKGARVLIISSMIQGVANGITQVQAEERCFQEQLLAMPYEL